MNMAAQQNTYLANLLTIGLVLQTNESMLNLVKYHDLHYILHQNFHHTNLQVFLFVSAKIVDRGTQKEDSRVGQVRNLCKYQSGRWEEVE